MIKRILCMVIGILLTLSLTACEKKDVWTEKQAFKMDTLMDIKAYGPNAGAAIDAAYQRIDEIEQMASASIDTSDVSKINRAAGKESIVVHPEIMKMIETSIKYNQWSNGAFDITVGPLIQLWGIGTSDERVPSDAEIQAKLQLVDSGQISVNEQEGSVKLMREGMSIELGGVAKGFATDEVVKVFEKYGIQSAVLNIGSSFVYTLGQKPDGTLWSVAIQHPRKDDNTSFLGIIRMPQQALSTSGDYERYFIEDGKRYHHILNPATGYPADAGVMSDTIVVDSSIPDCNMIADILTKVTFVSGIHKGLR